MEIKNNYFDRSLNAQLFALHLQVPFSFLLQCVFYTVVILKSSHLFVATRYIATETCSGTHFTRNELLRIVYQADR